MTVCVTRPGGETLAYDQVRTNHGQDVVVLAYRVVASRDGVNAYRSLCSSTYVLESGSWRLVQHQQTPA